MGVKGLHVTLPDIFQRAQKKRELWQDTNYQEIGSIGVLRTPKKSTQTTPHFIFLFANIQTEWAVKVNLAYQLQWQRMQLELGHTIPT